jgi:hypothetical protein
VTITALFGRTTNMSVKKKQRTPVARSGRPSKGADAATVILPVKLTAAMKKALVDVAAAEDRSLSYMARKFIDDGIERWKLEQAARDQYFAGPGPALDFDPDSPWGRHLMIEAAMQFERERREREKGNK